MFLLMMNKIDMIILNEYYMYLLYIYILTINIQIQFVCRFVLCVNFSYRVFICMQRINIIQVSMLIFSGDVIYLSVI